MASTQYRNWGDGLWDTGSWDEVRPITNRKRMPRVKTGVSRMDDPEVLQLVENIIASGTGKAELAGGPVTLAQLGTLKTEGDTALGDESMAVDTLAAKRTARAD